MWNSQCIDMHVYNIYIYNCICIIFIYVFIYLVSYLVIYVFIYLLLLITNNYISVCVFYLKA